MTWYMEMETLSRSEHAGHCVIYHRSEHHHPVQLRTVGVSDCQVHPHIASAVRPIHDHALKIEWRLT